MRTNQFVFFFWDKDESVSYSILNVHKESLIGVFILRPLYEENIIFTTKLNIDSRTNQFVEANILINMYNGSYLHNTRKKIK